MAARYPGVKIPDVVAVFSDLIEEDHPTFQLYQGQRTRKQMDIPEREIRVISKITSSLAGKVRSPSSQQPEAHFQRPQRFLSATCSLRLQSFRHNNDSQRQHECMSA